MTGMPHTQTATDYKAQARRLRAGLADTGHDLSHSAALELVARQHGVRDWNTLNALAARGRSVADLTIGSTVAGRYLGHDFTGELVALHAVEERALPGLDPVRHAGGRGRLRQFLGVPAPGDRHRGCDRRNDREDLGRPAASATRPLGRGQNSVPGARPGTAADPDASPQPRNGPVTGPFSLPIPAIGEAR